jgi:nitrite reductase/ring-hydroxylating ferredoxin subunit
MPGVYRDGDTSESSAAIMVPDGASVRRANPRPQRLHTWFHLISVKAFEKTRPERVLFLDSFVTILPKDAGNGANAANGSGGPAYTVMFEGEREMSVVVNIGVIFVWYGEDLLRPDRPFPRLYDEQYPSEYVTSKPSIFEKTHVMDFVENGSDNLHFRVVHLWESSKMYDHEISEETITLKQDTKFHFGSCSKSLMIRFFSNLLPMLELTHDYVYHGPGLAVVGAEGSGTPRMHALVSLTPEGPDRTRVYVTLAIDPTTFPAWAERAFQALFPKRALCDLLASVMANYIKNEFDIDAEIWENKKYLSNPRLLPVEKHLGDVIRWGETFYPKDFVAPAQDVKPPEARQWEYLDDVRNIRAGKVHSYHVAGEEVVAYQDEAGELHVFDAFCPHLGAHFGHGGLLKDGSLRCPFHGFHFDAEGRCLGPNPKNKSTFIGDLNLTRTKQRVEGGRVEVFV